MTGAGLEGLSQFDEGSTLKHTHLNWTTRNSNFKLPSFLRYVFIYFYPASRSSSNMAADDKSSSSSSTEWSVEPPVISPTSPSHLTHFKPLTPEQDEPPLRSAYSSFVNLFRFNNKGQGCMSTQTQTQTMTEVAPLCINILVWLKVYVEDKLTLDTI